MAKVWVLQHTPYETPGVIADALASRGVGESTVRTFAGESVPREMGEAVALVVMGGPMGVYDAPRYPFLAAEMRLIEDALQQDKAVLGVCLGSQLLAAALGAQVVKGRQKEIGWHPVNLGAGAVSDPIWDQVAPSLMGFHWHGDVFNLPTGALSLASSALTECQAFRYGRSAYGFLFHLEVTEPIIRGMIDAFSDELREAGIRGVDILTGIPGHLPALARLGKAVFGRWAGLAAEKQ